MDHTFPQPYKVIEVSLLAGKIMLQSGAETYRVEDTMERIAASLGIPHSHSFVTPTAIFFSVDGMQSAKLTRISNRTTDLYKVMVVNSISRKISSGELTGLQAFEQLTEIENKDYSFPIYQQVLAAAICSGCFLMMFLGQWRDFIPSFLAGGLGYVTFIYLHKVVHIKFFSEFIASFVIGITAFLTVQSGFGIEADKIIVGSVMPLVPGVLITNAVRDLMAGHLVSGMSKGADAVLTAFAIGSGIAAVFAFF